MEVLSVVALGNPGIKYKATRHNAGVWLLESLMKLDRASLKKHKNFAAEFAKGDSGIIYIRSTDYMNKNGIGISSVLRYFKIKPQQVLVLHDELDLKPGFARLKQAGGDGGHNGLKSLSLHIQSKDFWRLRIGVGRPESRDQVSNYVLGIPGLGDILKLKQSISLVANNFKHLKNGDEQAFMRSVHGEES